MELACGEARWLVLDDAHVPALGSEADSFDYGAPRLQRSEQSAFRACLQALLHGGMTSLVPQN